VMIERRISPELIKTPYLGRVTRPITMVTNDAGSVRFNLLLDVSQIRPEVIMDLYGAALAAWTDEKQRRDAHEKQMAVTNTGRAVHAFEQCFGEEIQLEPGQREIDISVEDGAGFTLRWQIGPTREIEWSLLVKCPQCHRYGESPPLYSLMDLGEMIEADKSDQIRIMGLAHKCPFESAGAYQEKTTAELLYDAIVSIIYETGAIVP
jgi:hypothetical protein